MATANRIDPFPADIDREAFGHWLSGFVDGEGCFRLWMQAGRPGNPRSPAASFTFGMRSDEAVVLRQIQSFWGCGHLYFATNERSKIPNAKPTATLYLNKTSDLANVLIPHFVRYPLRAKKSGDFVIWKHAVQLLSKVKSRPFRLRHARNRITGQDPKWTLEERAYFESLVVCLKEQRAYNGKTHLPKSPTVRSLPGGLFANV